MAGLTAVVFMMASSVIVSDASYNTSLSMCGSPSNPKTSEGYECTGALFTLVDINKLTAASKNENGCVAAMLGLSTQLKGYHCISFKNCPGADCTCEVRQGCSSSKAAASSNMKACLYGVQSTSQCPADAAAPAPGASASSAMSPKGSVLMIIMLVLLNCLLGASADYNTSVSMCGSPSNPKTSEGYECTGALFTLVDINKLTGAAKNENGCVAAMLGLSTQLKGYHCISFKNCPGAACTCEVRQGCSSSKAAAASTTKACLYGVKSTSQCPADAAAPAAHASHALSQKCSVAVVVSTVVVAIASALVGGL